MTAEANIVALREERRRAEVAARDHLARYVVNRQKAYEAFKSVDPEAVYTQDAQRRLEKAQRDLQEFEAYLASEQSP